MALTQWLFSIPLILTTLTALSASTPIYIWASLEVNTIVFIPMIITASKPESSQSAMKYFFIQAFASLIFLIGPLLHAPFMMFVTVAMLMKLGAAPFHNWFPAVMSNLSWSSAFILSTWQKVAPLCIMAENTMNIMFISLLASVNALIGGLGGLAQSEIRPLLAFSSIGHMGWLFYSMLNSSMTTLIYFLSYFFHLMLIMTFLHQSDMYSPKDIPSLMMTPKLMSLLIPLLLLSLGGLPPFLGFVPKLMIINLSTSSTILPLLLILGSYMNIYYYMTLMWGIFMNNFQDTKMNFNMTNMVFPSTLVISLMLLMILYGLNMYFQP